jgi:hypothetical protein
VRGPSRRHRLEPRLEAEPPGGRLAPIIHFIKSHPDFESALLSFSYGELMTLLA